jgi:hypothetical protein
MYMPADKKVSIFGGHKQPERSEGAYPHSVFESLSIIGRRSVNMAIPTPKIRAHQMVPKHKIVAIIS